MATYAARSDYYARLYPCEEVHTMLRMRDDAAERREISAQWPGDGNVYARDLIERKDGGDGIGGREVRIFERIPGLERE